MPRFLLALLALLAPPAAAQTFDLAGPALSLTVTRGERTLPIAQVPALAAGDTLTLRADLPADQSAHYLLVFAFLRGATNPPPKDWLHRVETWKRRKGTLTVAVPDGAQQAVAFLAPDTGGGWSAILDAVRGRPGVFVRAAQDLHQASLDRARLEAFVAGIGAVEQAAPDRLAERSPVLAGALGIKLNADCLTRARAAQAACLTQTREDMVLQTGRDATLAERLSGTPTDLAYSLAATPEGGAGLYSPYIALARDVAKLFGAFRSANYQYMPALAVADGARMRLQLNAAPSFQNPKSVLVAPLPPIGAPGRPVLRAGDRDARCLQRPGLVLPLEDAPLLYATGYAQDLVLRVTTADGATHALPVRADAQAGGLVLAGPARVGEAAITEAALHGRWGFDVFDGPRFAVQNGARGPWQAVPDAQVVVGRDHPLTLRGGAAACIDQVALRDGDASTALGWKVADPDEVTVTLPLKRAHAGALTLLVSQSGLAQPAALALTAQTEASRLDAFTLHAGDREGVLTGARLDQVAALEWGGTRFVPDALTRGEGGDRLAMVAAGDGALPTAGGEATVRLKDGRRAGVRASVTAARPAVTIVSRDVRWPASAGAALTLPGDLLPVAGNLTFSFRADGLTGADVLEVADAGDARAMLTVASGTLQVVEGVGIATLSPRAALGAGVAGALRVRLVRGATAGDWTPLTQVVRLPLLERVTCAAACTLAGSGLFLIASVATTERFADAVSVPPGFVGASVAVPRPIAGTLFLKLRDAPDAPVRATFGK
jgi:hypothetical protein